VVGLGELQISAQAASRLWKGTVSADWFTPENWEPAGVPASSDSVTIANGAGVTLSKNVIIAGINLDGGLDGAGNLTVQSAMNWTSGDIRVQLFISTGAQLKISGTANKGLPGGTIHNSGTTIWMDAGALVGYAGGSFENAGLFEIQNDSQFAYCCSGSLATLHNSATGTVRKTVSTGETRLGDWVLVNEGKIDVRTGTLLLTGQNHQLKTGGDFLGAGRTRVAGATVTLAGTSTVEPGGTFEFSSGGLNGDGGFNGSGTVEWSGGDITGKLSTAKETTFLISGDNSKNVPGGNINLAGTTIWRGTGGITGFADGRINNSGTFDAQNDAAFSYCCSGAIAQFNNSGLFLKSAGTAATVFSNFALNNSGQVQAKVGSIDLAGGGTSSGTFTTLTGAAIQFAGGIHVLREGAKVSGPGTTRIRNATVNLEGQTILDAGGTFELASGNVGGAGTFGGAGKFVWSGGDVGAALTISPATAVQLAGDNNKGLPGGKISNAGTILWEGTGQLIGYAGGAITNSGVFEMRNNSSLGYCCGGELATFNNLPEGTIRKTVANGESVLGDFVLKNSGRIDIQTGTLALAGPNHQLNEGGHFSGAGRTVVKTTVTVAGASTIETGGTLECRTGTIQGTGSFLGNGRFDWSSGTIVGNVTFGPGAQLILSTDGSHALVGGIVNNEGPATWQGLGNIVGYGGGVFNNRGIFEVRSDSSATYCCSGEVATFHNLPGGTFRKVETTGRTVFSNFRFNNDGLVQVLSGTLVLDSGASSGTFSNAPNASLEFGAGTTVLNSGGTFTIGGLSQIKPGAVVTLNGSHTIAAGGKFELAGGTLNGAGAISGPGEFLWSSGTLGGQLTLTAGTPALLTGSDNKNLAGGSLVNYGTITWTGAGSIIGWDDGSLTNHGVFEIQNDSGFGYCCSGGTATFSNESDGTIRKTVATGTTTLGSFHFYNSGTVDIQTGVLSLAGGANEEIRDGSRFSGAGRTRLDSSVKLSGNASIGSGGTLELRGTLVGPGAIAGPGTFEWTSGELRDGITFAPNAEVHISGDQNKSLVGAVVNNAGRIVWTGNGAIVGYAGAELHNTGLFEIKNRSQFAYCCAGTIATFFNEGGLLRKTSDGPTSFNSFNFINAGRMSIQAGTLQLADGTVIVGVCPVQMPGAVGIDLLPSKTEALLSWSPPQIADGGDNVNVLGFEIQKSADGGAFATVATLPASTFQMVVSDSCDGPVNSYRVHALTDGCNGGASPAVTIPRPTAPPVFLSKPQELVAAEKPFVYNAQAQDPEGAKVTYILLEGPAGMTVDPLTGTVQWTPPSALRGQFIPVRIAAFNGACGPKAEQSFSLAIGETPPPGGFKLRVGNVEMSADSLFRINQVGLQSTSGSSGRRISTQADIEDGTYKLGGDIKINDYLHFDGSVVVTLNKAAATLDVKVDEGKVYLTNIPLVGNKTVWQGSQVSFTVDGNGEVTKLLQDQLQNPLRAAGVDITIERAQLLLQNDLGIRLFGKLKIPDVYGVTALSGEFDNLEITQQHGIRFTGQVHLADFELGGMGLRNVVLNWVPNENDPTLDKFEGDAQLSTPAFELAVKVALAGGALDGIGADLNFPGIGIPVPPPTPFLNITGGGLEVGGLRAGPFSIGGTVDVTLVHPVLKNLVSLSQVGLKYTYPSTLNMKGDFRLLTAKAAHAFLKIELPYRFALGGDVKLLEDFPVLLISADLAAGITPDPIRFFVEGGATGKLQVPSYDEFPGFIKNAFPLLILTKPFLPKTLAQAAIAYRNGMFSSSIGLPIIGDVVVAVKYAQNQVQLLVGQNLSSLTKVIGLSAAELTNPTYQKAMLLSLNRDRASMGGSQLEGDGLYVPAAVAPVAQTVGTVAVPVAAPRVIFRLFAGSGAPRFSLIKPDGTRLTAAAAGDGNYQEIAETKETYFVVVTPVAGNWTIEAEDGSKGPFVLDAWGANAAPTIASVSAAPAGGDVTVNYSAADPDDNVTVALYYDTDATGFNGSLITDGLPQSAAGSYTWHTANVPSGDYYVYAVIDDGKNVPAQRYASTKVTIVDPLAPATPRNVKVISGGENNLIVSWDANTEANLRGYLIRYGVEQGPTAELTESVDAGKTNVYRLPRLLDNTSYRVSVVAYAQIENAAPAPTEPKIAVHQSAPSDPVIGKTEFALIPVVRVTSPAGGEKLMQNSSLTISWKLDHATNVVDQQIDLSTDGGATWRPLAKHVSLEKRNYIWDIPVSMQTSRGRIRVSVLDKAANEGIGVTVADFSVSGADSDGDGIPDAWEIAHGLNPNSKDDAALDSDGDGLTNLQEYLAGTDPQNAQSAFRAAAGVSASGDFQVSFNTVAGKQYVVERTDDLGSGQWTQVSPVFNGDGSLKSVNDGPPSATSRFYRVRVQN